MICCTDNTDEVSVPIKHILLSSALLKNNLLQKQKSTFCLSKETCVSDKTTTLMWSWRNLCKITIFLMVDNVSSHQSLWWGIVFFVQKICYNLTVSVTLYYTLANFDPNIDIWIRSGSLLSENSTYKLLTGRLAKGSSGGGGRLVTFMHAEETWWSSTDWDRPTTSNIFIFYWFQWDHL